MRRNEAIVILESLLQDNVVRFKDKTPRFKNIQEEVFYLHPFSKEILNEEQILQAHRIYFGTKKVDKKPFDSATPGG